MAEAASYTALPQSLWVTAGMPYQGFSSLRGTLPYGYLSNNYGSGGRTYGGYFLVTDIIPLPTSDFTNVNQTPGVFGTTIQL